MTSRSEPDADACAHCGLPLPLDADGPYCCSGCRAAREMLTACGLEQFYALRDGPGTAVGERGAAERSEPPWLVEAKAKLAGGEALALLELDVQGLRCAACVWLFERMFERQPGAVEIAVNPGAGKLRLVVRGGEFDLGRYVADVESFGYRLGPSIKAAANPALRRLMIRLGVAVAIAMNTMMLSLAVYLGLAEGPVYTVMSWGAWALSVAAVIVGGTPFFQSAWQAVRRRLLHLDIPIALGILLAFGGSTYSFFFQEGRAAYFDTVATFIALMLLGRLLQERHIDRNRRALLADDGIERLVARAVEGGKIKHLRYGEITKGARLMLLPGDLVPVDARLASPSADLSYQWITGESHVGSLAEGETIPAGAFVVGPRAVFADAASDFAGSTLASLLRTPTASGTDLPRTSTFWRSVTRVYVVAVLLLASGGAALWLVSGAGASKAIEVAVAVLVVTCPCALGIATPLAYEMALARLRREGVFVRSPSLLDRARSIRKIIFDKTGTLTIGTLRIVDASPLSLLEASDRHALYDMVARSSHPKSRVLAEALVARGAVIDAAAEVEELTGRGLELRLGGHVYRLGSRAFTDAGDAPGDVFFSRDGQLLAALETEERLRPRTPEEIAALSRDGLEVHLLSGDSPARVERLAAALGIPRERARAAASPDDKDRYVRGLDRADTLMVGDGVNDAAALASAHCSGTPLADLPFLPARTDFYATGDLVGGVRALLATAQLLHHAIRHNLAVAVAYNVAAVGLSYAGLMSPLLCAIVMPLSSVSVVAWTAARLAKPIRPAVAPRAPLPAPVPVPAE